ncbi:MAG: serine--tRNA ligase [Acidimicrobiia bacterium]
MLDVSLLRNDPDGLAAAMERRGIAVDIRALAESDAERRQARAAAEKLRAEQNRRGKEIAGLAGDEKQAAVAAMADLAERYKAALTEADELDARFDAEWSRLPNLPHESVPVGRDDADNEEVRRWGEPTAFDFDPLDHLAIGEALGIIDTERAAKVSGSRFAYLKGQLVLLHFGLIQWAMGKLVSEGFIPVLPPVLVREAALYGTGFLPSGREQAYAVGVSQEGTDSIEPDDLFLVGTSEVPLAAMHGDEILEGPFPLRYTGYSSCFRREAGTYGKDTRGMFRVHQFEKLEMFSFVDADQSWDEHDRLLATEESLVQALGIPYRVVNVCAGELGDPYAKKYDIEAWFPGQSAYREITSCSNATDFQARRLRTRYRTDNGTAPVHTLNGTAISGRFLISILENNQRVDGTVVVPEVLRPFVGLDALTP